MDITEQQTTKVLHDLLDALSSTVDAWDYFCDHSRQYFHDLLATSDRVAFLMQEVEAVFENVREYKHTLLRLKDRHWDNIRDVDRISLSF